MKQVPLTQGYVAFVDDDDVERVSQFKWYALVQRKKDRTIKNVYAATGCSKIVYLHRFILGVTDPNVLVDHEDFNGLNCQRHNIRPCTRQQNIQHSRKRLIGLPASSIYKGVSGGKWVASIGSDVLGYFDSEIEAARAYDKAALERYGNFAALNFPM